MSRKGPGGPGRKKGGAHCSLRGARGRLAGQRRAHSQGTLGSLAGHKLPLLLLQSLPPTRTVFEHQLPWEKP